MTQDQGEMEDYFVLACKDLGPNRARHTKSGNNKQVFFIGTPLFENLQRGSC